MVIDSERLWTKTLTAAMNLPGVKVDRGEFLKSSLEGLCTDEEISNALKTNPIKSIGVKRIDKAASACIRNHTIGVTALSAIVSLPGGIAMAATIPSDIAQFYWHVLVLSQKLAYLYGFPDFRDENGELSEAAINMLTLFVGVMMGYGAAKEGFNHLVKEFMSQFAENIPERTLMRVGSLPIVVQTAKRIGINLEKSLASKGMSKVLPLIGGIVSGALTFASFHPGAINLQKILRTEMSIIYGLVESEDNKVENILATAISNEEIQTDTYGLILVEALINMAKISGELSPSVKSYIRNYLKKSTIDMQAKTTLMIQLKSKKPVKIDFTTIQTDETFAASLINSLIEIANIDGKMTPEESTYIKEIIHELHLKENEYSKLNQKIK
jgi:tellurite resistance protein